MLQLAAEQLQAMYRHIASFDVTSIGLHLWLLDEEPKIAALLDTARELAGE